MNPTIPANVTWPALRWMANTKPVTHDEPYLKN